MPAVAKENRNSKKPPTRKATKTSTKESGTREAHRRGHRRRRDTEAEAGIADVVDDHIPRIAARSVRWRAAVFRSCRTGSNRSGLTAPLSATATSWVVFGDMASDCLGTGRA